MNHNCLKFFIVLALALSCKVSDDSPEFKASQSEGHENVPKTRSLPESSSRVSSPRDIDVFVFGEGEKIIAVSEEAELETLRLALQNDGTDEEKEKLESGHEDVSGEMRLMTDHPSEEYHILALTALVDLMAVDAGLNQMKVEQKSLRLSGAAKAISNIEDLAQQRTLNYKQSVKLLQKGSFKRGMLKARILEGAARVLDSAVHVGRKVVFKVKKVTLKIKMAIRYHANRSLPSLEEFNAAMKKDDFSSLSPNLQWRIQKAKNRSEFLSRLGKKIADETNMLKAKNYQTCYFNMRTEIFKSDPGFPHYSVLNKRIETAVDLGGPMPDFKSFQILGRLPDDQMLQGMRTDLMSFHGLRDDDTFHFFSVVEKFELNRWLTDVRGSGVHGKPWRLEFMPEGRVGNLNITNITELAARDRYTLPKKLLEDGIDSVAEAIRSNKNIYIHCKGGKSRSATTVIGARVSLMIEHARKNGKHLSQKDVDQLIEEQIVSVQKSRVRWERNAPPETVVGISSAKKAVLRQILYKKAMN